MGMGEREVHPNRVPGAEDAVAPDDKFRSYLLDPAHPKGGPKSKFFAELGWTQDRWEELRDHFLAELPFVEGIFSRVNEYNGAADYKAVIEIVRAGGELLVPVGTYWEVHPDHPTKFLTAYPL